jgi:uncharacterized protein with PQ loop repeat
MEESSITHTIIIGAFTASSIIRIWFYFPQIRSVWRSTDAAAINVFTWLNWSIHNVISIGYAIVAANDPLMASVFAANAICTSWITYTAYTKQKKAKLSKFQPTPASIPAGR